MQITNLGHSCLLLDYDGARVLIDPGTFSNDITGIEGLDAVIITHQHPDHVDIDRLPAVRGSSPGARLLAEPATAAVLAQGGITAEPFAAGDTTSIGGVEIAGVGGDHAVIHRDLPRVGNTGLVLRAEGQPSFFHPGDMIDTTPEGIDVLGYPLTAPWCAAKETIEFLRAMRSAVAIPIHDAIVSAPGRGLYLMLTTNFAPEGTTVRDISGAGPTTF
jgi:L-ascorbate metabolism protein UlaG (beta-lactamase superfamily)